MEGPFAIIGFEDGIEIIKTDWAVRDNERIIASYFPPNVTRLQLRKLLCCEEVKFNKKEWSNEEGQPYLVQKVFGLANDLEAAEESRDLHIQLSEVDSDQNINNESLKRSRHLRNLKKMSDEDMQSDEGEIEGRRPLSVISNTLWRPKLQNVPMSSNSKPSALNADASSTPLTPSVSNGAPLASNTAHSTLNGAPSALNTAPSTVNGAPSALNTVQSTLNGAPSALNTAPSTLNGAPLVPNTAPSTSDGAPSTSHAAPSTSKERNNKAHKKKSGSKYMDKLNSIDTMVRSICRNAVRETGGPTFANKDADLEKFPAKTKKEVEKLSKRLKKRESFYTKVCNAAVNLGLAENSNITISKILNQLLTFEAGRCYTFDGRSGKKPAFKMLKFKDLVIDAMNRLQPSATMADITKGIRCWLYACKKNQDRELDSIEKQRRNANNETVDDEEESSSTDDQETESEDEMLMEN